MYSAVAASRATRRRSGDLVTGKRSERLDRSPGYPERMPGHHHSSVLTAIDRRLGARASGVVSSGCGPTAMDGACR